ncbi:hypothetical protein HGRIS_014943 [Hohenbuehelia grisea]|uniref:Uncharacterized protein n=1 Tax=Hohenbuehelia grisea TaxID=104357 RepID=A0ABR3IZK9_9AGAR
MFPNSLKTRSQPAELATTLRILIAKRTRTFRPDGCLVLMPLHTDTSSTSVFYPSEHINSRMSVSFMKAEGIRFHPQYPLAYTFDNVEEPDSCQSADILRETAIPLAWMPRRASGSTPGALYIR